MLLWKKTFYYMFYFCLQMFAFLLSLMSEKWFLVLLGLELSIFSIIPLMASQKNQFSMKFFMMKVMASLFMILGKLLISSNLFTLGMLMKLSNFPLMWFPFIMNKKMKNFILFWMLTGQKFPVYLLWKEFFIMKESLFYYLGMISLILSSMLIFSSKNLYELLSWKSVIHSILNLFMVNLLSMTKFFLMFFSYVFILFIFLVLMSYYKWKYLVKIKKKFLLFFAFAGLPLFIKVVTEILLFFQVKYILALMMIFSLIMQMSGFLVFYLKNYLKTKDNKKKFFQSLSFGLILMYFFLMFFFIYLKSDFTMKLISKKQILF